MLFRLSFEESPAPTGRARLAKLGHDFAQSLIMLGGYLWWWNRWPRGSEEEHVFAGGSTAIAPHPLRSLIAALPLYSPTSAVNRFHQLSRTDLQAALTPYHAWLRMLREMLADPSVPELPLPEAEEFDLPFKLAEIHAGALLRARVRLSGLEDDPAQAVAWALDLAELNIRLVAIGLHNHLVAFQRIWLALLAVEEFIPALNETTARQAGYRFDRLCCLMPTAPAWLEQRRRERFHDVRRWRQRGEKTNGWELINFDRAYRWAICEAVKPFCERAEPPDFPALLTNIALPVDYLLAHYLTLWETLAGLVRLEFALQAHHCRAGQYPESLSGLAAELLPALPTDSLTGEPFRYCRRSEGYLLYSPGPDGVDQGGIPVPLFDCVLRNEPGDLVAGSLAARRDSGEAA